MFKDALTEMNDLIGLKNDGSPLVITEEMTEAECQKLIKEAIPILNKTDFFTKETTAVLKELGWDRNTLDEGTTLDEDISNAETLKELKDIALAEPQFKSIRGKLASFKTVDDLRQEMFWLLSPKPVPEKLHDKIEDAPIKAPVIEKGNFPIGPEIFDEAVNVETFIEDVTAEPIETKTIVTGTLTAKEKEEMKVETIRTEDILIREPFVNLFAISDGTFKAIKRNMDKKGYDYAFPVVLWGNTLLDGHTRLRAASALGIEQIPFIQKEFKSEKDALEYCIHNQRDRRNISQAALLKCIQVLDKPMTRKEAGAKGGRATEEKETPSHVVTAKILGVGESKVTDARVVLKDEQATQDVMEGKVTISQAAKKFRKKREKIPVVKSLNRIDATIKVLKQFCGKSVNRVYLVEESDNVFLPFGYSDINEQERTVNFTIPVLVSLKFVRVDGERLIVKKTFR